jgi:hypothetical protein
VSGRVLRTLLAVGLALAGLAAGAYGDWILWHPMDGLMLTLGAGSLLIVAGVVALIPRRAARTAALGVLVFALGVVGGQVLAPGRPALMGADGTISMALDQAGGVSGAHVATCQTTGSGTELQISGDPNLRVDLLDAVPGAPADLDQRAFVGISITVGDRWRDHTVARADNVDLLVSVASVIAGANEVMLAASDASAVEIAWTPAGGTLRFAGLVGVTDGRPKPADLDLRGTITWTCEAARP